MRKLLSVLLLPTFATFFGTIGTTWNIPYTQEIVITITALSTFLGVVLTKASYDYAKKKLIVKEIEENKSINQPIETVKNEIPQFEVIQENNKVIDEYLKWQ